MQFDLLEGRFDLGEFSLISKVSKLVLGSVQFDLKNIQFDLKTVHFDVKYTHAEFIALAVYWRTVTALTDKIEEGRGLTAFLFNANLHDVLRTLLQAMTCIRRRPTIDKMAVFFLTKERLRKCIPIDFSFVPWEELFP